MRSDTRIQGVDEKKGGDAAMQMARSKCRMDVMELVDRCLESAYALFADGPINSSQRIHVRRMISLLRSTRRVLAQRSEPVGLIGLMAHAGAGVALRELLQHIWDYLQGAGHTGKV